MKRKLDLAGQKFNMLTAIKYVGNDYGGRSLWLFKCDCGGETIKKATVVKCGKIKSCGCLLNENCRSSGFGTTNSYRKTHGMTNTRLHHIWLGILYRCSDKNLKYQARYFVRGIRVCDEWKTFENFYDWSINNGYREDLTIDRIDNDGNYEPSNCRWVDRKAQNNNRSSNHMISYKGETKNVTQWMMTFDSYAQKFYRYLDKGFSDGDAIEKIEEEYIAKNLSD